LKALFWVFAAAGPVAVGLWFLGALSPVAVETLYSRGVYPFLMSPWSRLTSSVPFALAPWTLLIVVAAAISSFFFWPPPKALAALGAGTSLILAWFVLGWGLNYQRHSWGDNHGWNVRGGTVVELESLADRLADRAAGLRSVLGEKPVDWSSREIRRAVTKAYERAGRSDPLLGGSWGDAKKFPLPEAMSWLGLAGIFVPFTAEPLVNSGPADWQLPFTMAHEAAHLRGWAREDEANFLAFWVLHDDSDPLLAYSAWSSALLYVAQALGGTELGIEAWKRVSDKMTPEMKRDWARSFEYWDRFRGPVSAAAGAINDAYLKSQGQSDGIRSYGRMVDLLLAGLKVSPLAGSSQAAPE